MKKFEHFTTSELIKRFHDGNTHKVAEERDFLKAPCHEGFELVAVVKYKKTFIYYWKRELPDNTETK